jgi:hypothetical protein
MDFDKLLGNNRWIISNHIDYYIHLKKGDRNVLDTKFSLIEKKLDIINKAGALLFEKETKLYDALSSIAYKARNCSRDFIESGFKEQDKLIIHNTVCDDFENLLYHAKIHIDNNLFELIHSYKVKHKRLNLLLNKNPDPNNPKIKQKYEIIEQQYQNIVKELKNIIEPLKKDIDVFKKKEK